MIVTDEDDDTTTTSMTRTAYVRYHDITAWSLRERRRKREENVARRRKLPTARVHRPLACFFSLPPTHSPSVYPSPPLLSPLHSTLSCSRSFSFFMLPLFPSPSLTPRMPPSLTVRCCTTPWFSLWLLFYILVPSHLIFFSFNLFPPPPM